MLKNIFCLVLLVSCLLPWPVLAETEGSTVIFSDGFESADTREWSRHDGELVFPPLDLAASLTKTSISLPGGARNAPERAPMVHYLGTGKSIDGSPRQQLPFRAYFASCATDTAEPRMFVSLTLEDTGNDANPDHPRVGSVFEARYNTDTGALEPTANAAVLPLCNESHGIAVSEDCSQVGLLCATAIEENFTPTYTGTVQDLVASTSQDSRYTREANNVDIINGIGGLTQAEREARYMYNGEVWLLEWSGNKALTAEPDKFVIHKAVGGAPHGGLSLVYSDTDDSYGAAFITNLFDDNHGGRHRSASLMVVERNGWKLNPDDRGWGWLCGYGHVHQIRAFWNPHITDERNGEFSALCTSDGNTYQGFLGGSIATKQESSNSFQGYTNYLVASSNSGVANGGGHNLIPIDASRSIGVLTAAEMEPWDNEDFAAFVRRAQRDSPDLPALKACNNWNDNWCLFEYMRWEHSGVFPLFKWGFWWKDIESFVPTDLARIGIFHTEVSGRTIAQKDGAMVKWLAQDDDCMFGAPQLVDLQNGRYLLGFGKFQCISDGFHLRRFATGANNTRSVATQIPSEYYLMEIDADGYPRSAPTLVSGSGWGGLDHLVNLGPGRVGWAYIPSPELQADGSFPDPEQATWELVVYESQD